MAIKAVLFDLGNTLVKYDYDSPEEVFQRILTSMGIIRSLEEVKKAFLNAKKEAEDLNLLSSFGKMKCEKYWKQWDSLVLKHLDIQRNSELARIVQSKWLSFVDATLFPEVKEILSKLKQKKLKTGLISTAYKEEIELILEMVGLGKTAFDVIVGVDTTKKVKPSPEVFKYAITSLRVKSEEALFVGDNVEADYNGALEAGMQALLLDRAEKEHDGLRKIKNLKEILSRID